jgi:flagellar biogenesis protein FliO
VSASFGWWSDACRGAVLLAAADLPGSGAADDPADYAAAVVRMVAVLVLLCAAAAIAVRWRPAWAGGSVRSGGDDLLRVVAARPLEPGRTLYLVEVAGQFVLVASTPQGVSSLTQAVVDPESVRRRLAPSASEPPSAT